jgi:hypothetical protein
MGAALRTPALALVRRCDRASAATAGRATSFSLRRKRRWRSGLEKRLGRNDVEHVFYECDGISCRDRGHCVYCEGGLAYCTVCKKGEGELEKICPGALSEIATDNSNERPMTQTMDFTPRPSAAFASAFEELLDKAMQAENAAQPPREYIGGSRLGEECLRKLGFEFHKVPKDEPFEGRTLRIFERGHSGEDLMARRLRLAGFDLLTERPDGKQFEFMTAGGRIGGHLDGVVRGGPAQLILGSLTFPLRYPCLWENKILGDKGFKDLVRKGLRASKWVYFVQMQLYMAYLQLADWPGLFTAENGNTGEIYAELIPFDAAVAQEASDKGVRVVTSTEPEDLPRVATKSTDYRCKFCDYAARCWASEHARIAAGMDEKTWSFGTRG